MKSLKVGKVIYQILINNTDLSNIVHKLIYPLIADDDTQFPFIVYKRSSIDILGTKDGFVHEEDAVVDVVIASDKYNECVNIASLVADALNGARYRDDDLICRTIKVISAEEDYIENTFIQKISVKITLLNT